MGDIILESFLWARRRDRSILRRLILRGEPLAAGGVEHVTDSACAARVVVDSQYERSWTENMVVPASRVNSYYFQKRATPSPPVCPTFECRRETFHIHGGTPSATTCLGCNGTGRTCKDVGCQKHPHEECGGEGRVAKWNAECYEYFATTRRESFYPVHPAPASLTRGHDAWLRKHDERVETFLESDVRAHIGSLSNEGTQVLDAAVAGEARLITEAGSGPNWRPLTSGGVPSLKHLGARVFGHYGRVRWLFDVVTRSVAPLSGVFGRAAGRGDWFFLVGRGDDAIPASPGPRLDYVKLTAWASVVTLLVLATATILKGGISGIPLSETLGPIGLACVAIAIAVLGAPGIARMTVKPAAVHAVAVLPEEARATAFLPLLAFLGSAHGFLTVTDGAHDDLLRSLSDGHSRQTRTTTLTVHSPGVGHVRLLEVPAHQALPADDWRRLAWAADGFLLLRHSSSRKRDSALISEHAKSSTRGRIPTVSAMVDASTPDGSGMALEEWRAKYLQGGLDGPEGRDVFRRLWKPIERMMRG